MIKKLNLNISVFIAITAFTLSGCSTQLDKLSKEHQPKKRENYESKTKESSEIAGDAFIRQEAEFANEDLYISEYESVIEDTATYDYKDYKTEQFYNYRYISLMYRSYRLKAALNYNGSRFRHHRIRHFARFHSTDRLHHSARLHHLLRSGIHSGTGFGHGHHPHPGFNF